MKTLFQIRWNFKTWVSTNADLLKLFADVFQMPVEVKEIGLTTEEIEIERL